MDVFQSILQRVGIRQLPGICWYPAKRTGRAVNQGGTADSVVLFIYVHDSSLTDLFFSVRGVFFIPINSSDKIATKSSVMISGSEV